MTSLRARVTEQPCVQHVLRQVPYGDGQLVQLAHAQDEVSRRPCICQGDALDLGASRGNGRLPSLRA